MSPAGPNIWALNWALCRCSTPGAASTVSSHFTASCPAGGLRQDGLRWMRPPSPDFFLPQAVLADRFRNRLKERLAREDPEELERIPPVVWRQKWVVDVQPVGSGEGALKYLPPTCIGPRLGSQRILSDQGGKITFKYKDSGDRRWHILCCP